MEKLAGKGWATHEGMKDMDKGNHTGIKSICIQLSLSKIRGRVQSRVAELVPYEDVVDLMATVQWNRRADLYWNEGCFE